MVIRWEQFSLFPFGVLAIIFMSVSFYAKKFEQHCRNLPLLSKMYLCTNVSYFAPCSTDALQRNQEMEFQRNKERFQFLKWGAKAFHNMLIVPPGSGIVHQVNPISFFNSEQQILGQIFTTCLFFSGQSGVSWSGGFQR